MECTGQHIVVYAGQNSTPVISVDKTGYYNGYISYVTYDASALFMNFNTTASSAKWNTFSGTVSGIGKSVSVSSTTDGEREIHGAVSLAGKAYTNLICTAKIAVNSKSEISSNGGILLSASEGKSAFEDGVYIGLNSENKLFVSVKGREVSAYPLSKSLGTADIMIVKQDKEFKVYLNHNQNLLFSMRHRMPAAVRLRFILSDRTQFFQIYHWLIFSRLITIPKIKILSAGAADMK